MTTQRALLHVALPSLVALSACQGSPAPASAPMTARGAARSETAHATEVTTRVLVEDGGAVRHYAVSAHGSASGPLPLVLVFHGGGMSGEAMRTYADLESRASSPAIFVYPDAVVRNVWADEYALHWDGTRDLAFVDHVVRGLLENGQVDAKRVYAFGLSSGAYFVNQLACAWGKRLAGFVAVEGGGPYGDCNGATSAMIVHDPADPVVPASEGKESLTRWLTEDRCPSEIATPSHAPPGCVARACALGTRVVTCSPAAGVHAIGPSVRENALRFFGL